MSNSTVTVNETKEVVENTSQTTSTTPVEKGSADEELRAQYEALNTRIRLVDQIPADTVRSEKDYDDSNELDLFCYVNCNAADDALIRECRGVVFHKNKVVLRAFPYTPELNHTETEELAVSLSDFTKCSFFDSHEGTLIRVFNFNGKWFISTHRKLNAFRSKWASRESFGDSFKVAIDEEYKSNKAFNESMSKFEDNNLIDNFFSTLNPEHQYMFLVRNTKENRIVCLPPDVPTLYHVGTFINNEVDVNNDIGITRPKLHTFKNVDELVGYVNSVDVQYMQGVIAFLPNNAQLKIVNKEYQDFFQVRGNEPSIKFRYLQVRMTKKVSSMLHNLYPEYSEAFNEYENILYEIAINIHRAYINRFISKRYVTVPTEEFAVIRECHAWHISDRVNHRISIDKVIDVLNTQRPTTLNKMIRRYRIDQSKQKDDPPPLQQYVPILKTRIKPTPSPTVSPMILPTKNTPREEPSDVVV
jgi:hypothetical protein